jgi:hypothetical protein
MKDDDEIAVNSNTQGNNAKLQVMFNHEQFLELDKSTMSDDYTNNSKAGVKK